MRHPCSMRRDCNATSSRAIKRLLWCLMMKTLSSGGLWTVACKDVLWWWYNDNNNDDIMIFKCSLELDLTSRKWICCVIFNFRKQRSATLAAFLRWWASSLSASRPCHGRSSICWSLVMWVDAFLPTGRRSKVSYRCIRKGAFVPLELYISS